jgi:hypothetical protein
VIDGFGPDVFDGNARGSYDLEILVFDDSCNQ